MRKNKPIDFYQMQKLPEKPKLDVVEAQIPAPPSQEKSKVGVVEPQVSEPPLQDQPKVDVIEAQIPAPPLQEESKVGEEEPQAPATLPKVEEEQAVDVKDCEERVVSNAPRLTFTFVGYEGGGHKPQKPSPIPKYADINEIIQLPEDFQDIKVEGEQNVVVDFLVVDNENNNNNVVHEPSDDHYENIDLDNDKDLDFQVAYKSVESKKETEVKEVSELDIVLQHAPNHYKRDKVRVDKEKGATDPRGRYVDDSKVFLTNTQIKQQNRDRKKCFEPPREPMCKRKDLGALDGMLPSKKSAFVVNYLADNDLGAMEAPIIKEKILFDLQEMQNDYKLQQTQLCNAENFQLQKKHVMHDDTEFHKKQFMHGETGIKFTNLGNNRAYLSKNRITKGRSNSVFQGNSSMGGANNLSKDNKSSKLNQSIDPVLCAKSSNPIPIDLRPSHTQYNQYRSITRKEKKFSDLVNVISVKDSDKMKIKMRNDEKFSRDTKKIKEQINSLQKQNKFEEVKQLKSHNNKLEEYNVINQEFGCILFLIIKKR